MTLSRVETEIEGSPEEIIKIIKNLENRKKNPTTKEISLIEQIDEDTAIYYQVLTFPVPFMSDRDFVCAYGVIREADSTYFIQKSIEHDSKPVTKKNVRSIMH